MRQLALLAPLVVLLGCLSPPAPGPGAGPEHAVARLDGLLARGQFEVVRDEARELQSRDLPGDLLARVHLAEARALSRLGHHGSSLLAFGRARGAVPRQGGDLDRAVLRAWGDAELRAGRARSAARRYEEAFEDAERDSPEADALSLSVAVALQAAGSPLADSWRRRIRRPRSASLRTLESTLTASLGRPTASPLDAGLRVDRGAAGGTAAIVPGLRSRAQWSASAIRGEYDPMSPVWRITVHHGATRFTSTSASTAAAEIRDVQRFHQRDRRWADIGYHLLIDPAGRVWEGRSLAFQGAHAGNPDLNRGNVGIMLLGNFNEQSLPVAQQRSLARTLGLLSDHYGIQRGHIYTHSEVRPGPTECPGRALQRWMDGYRRGSPAMASRQ